MCGKDPAVCLEVSEIATETSHTRVLTKLFKHANAALVQQCIISAITSARTGVVCSCCIEEMLL